MGCKFCASTIGGKVRDLLPGELLGQIIAASRDLGERIDNVVMMGIGEPLDNYDNVVQFLRLVAHPDGLNIGYRHISLSTCGIVPRILDLAELAFPITLSISLHAVTDEKRSFIMPVNRKWNIDALLTACADYYRKTSRRISFEYTLLHGENDGEEEAKALAALLKKYMRGMPIHVNLIRVNEVKETAFVRGGAESVRRFAEVLSQNGVNATVRRRLGADIDGACGQLRRRHGGKENAT
jgi:23S rRNA (adenine2503-C2)-methyltransferase